MRSYRAMSAAVALMALVVAAGCVEQDTDLQIRGVVALGGEKAKEDIDCEGGGGGMSTTTYTKPVYACEFEVEPGSVTDFRGRGRVNIRQLGQTGLNSQVIPNEEIFSDSEYCAYRSGNSQADFERLNTRNEEYTITLDVVNKLVDGREIGSEGQGGGGGGFENLRVNTNDVNIQTLEMSFPNVSAGFGTLTYDFNLLAESGGGGATLSFELFTERQKQDLQRVHKAAFQQQRDGNWQNNLDAEVPVVAEIRIEGETLGGREVESNIFRWPMELCVQGCETNDLCAFAAQRGG